MADEENVEPNGAVLGPGSHPASSPERVTAARGAIALGKQLDAINLEDRNAAELVLRPALGDEYSHGVRLINNYLNSLPQQQREEIENRVMPNGVRALNDPATLIKLGEQALGLLPRDPAAITEEIRKHEARIRTDRRGWNKDERAQMRLRLLYRSRDGEE